MKAAATEAACAVQRMEAACCAATEAMSFRRHVVSARPPQPAPKGRPSASMDRMPRAGRWISTLSACASARLIPFMASLSAIQRPSLRAKRSNPSRHVKKERADCSAEPHRARVRATRWLAMTSNPATSSCLVRALSLAWRPATSSRSPARHDDEFKPSWGIGAVALSHHFVEKDSGSRPFAAIKKTHS